MKKIKFKTVAAAALALVFTLSIGATIAAWVVSGKTDNVVSLATVSGVIVEDYETATDIYPSATVKKEVTVENTGTAPAFCRVKLIREWNAPEGSDTFLDPNAIILNTNTEDWSYSVDTEYYYYKKILEPGEASAPLLNSFTFDASVSNEYAGAEGVITVQMELLQAGEAAAESYWGVTYEQLGISYDAAASEPLTTTIDFNGKDEGFAFSQNAGDLFYAYKNMLPGESRSQVICVSNHSNESTELFLWSEPALSQSSDLQLVEELLEIYSSLIITDDNGEMIYDGSLLPQEGSERLNVSLGTFAPGESKNLNLTLLIDPELGNDFAEIAAKLTWGVKAMGEDAVIPPPTEDNTVIFPYVLTAFASAAALLFLVLTKKKRKESEESEKCKC